MVDENLNVFVEVRKTRCFKWGKMGLVRSEYNPPREETEEKEEKEKEFTNETEYSNQETVEGWAE